MEMNQVNTALCILILWTVSPTCADDESCDTVKCPGPLAYYKDVQCLPIYEQPNDCCAVRYDCDRLKSLSRDKCYVNSNEYEIGETLREEDASPCDIGCTCVQDYDGIASFNCGNVDCFSQPAKPDCYRKNSPLSCCAEEEVCPENPEDRATCVVNGKTYKDGEHFSVESDPDLNCVCQEGYKGENVEPFCATLKRPYCSTLFRQHSDVEHNCAPVYFSNQSPQTSCSVFSRCQNDNDTVIHNDVDNTVADAATCTFGSLTMNRGDELNQGTDYSSVCVKCVCEIPPVPTCQRLPDDACDVTKHPPFDAAEKIKLIGSSIKNRMLCLIPMSKALPQGIHCQSD